MLVVESNLFEPFEDKSVQEFRHGFWTLEGGRVAFTSKQQARQLDPVTL
jgi:hypothetical protein